MINESNVHKLKYVQNTEESENDDKQVQSGEINLNKTYDDDVTAIMYC